MSKRFRQPQAVGKSSPGITRRAALTWQRLRLRPQLENLEARDMLSGLAWSAGVNLSTPSGASAAILASDNSILVLGSGTSDVAKLNAGATSWGLAASLGLTVSGPAVGATGGGGFLMYGGSVGGRASDAAIQYDYMNSDNTRDAPNLSSPRTDLAFAADSALRQYAIGGIDDSGNRLASVERFDPATGQWSAVASLPQPLSGTAAVNDGAGHILVFGGTTASAQANTTVLRYTATTNTWDAAASLPTAVCDAAAVRGADGNIYVLGGKNANGTTVTTVQQYNPATNSWSAATALPNAVSNEAAVTDSQGRIEVIGGLDAAGTAVSSVLVTQSLGAGGTAGTTNVAPIVTTPPNATVAVGVTFSYQVLAGGSPEPTFTLIAAPAGMTIESNSGTISWTPGLTQVGTQTITAQAANVAGSSAATFTINVPSPLPTITSAALPNGMVGAAYSGAVAATAVTAPGAAAPTFQLVTGPTGLAINANTGAITWMPSTAQLGAQTVTVQASNFAGAATKSFTITVGPDITPPTVPTLSVGAVSTSSITLTWTPSTDNVAVAGYRVFNYTPAVYRGHSGRGGGYTLVSPAKYTLLADNINSTNYTFRGLAPASFHSYAVAAVDTSGNQSGFSAPLTAETWQLPSVTWSTNGVTTDPALTVVANHSLYMTIWGHGNPTPTFSLLSAPSGVVFTPGQFTNSQLTTVIPNITWTPTAAQVGLQYITMRSVNAAGTVDTVIPVTVLGDVPVPSLTINGGLSYTLGNFTTVANTRNTYDLVAHRGFDVSGGSHPQYALAGTPFTFQLTGTSNTNPTTYSLISGPAGLTLNPNTGVATWTPTKSEASNSAVTVAATNSAGTSTLTVHFLTYFTTAPSNVTVGYFTSNPTGGTSGVSPTVAWSPPIDTTGLAGYKVTVTDVHTNVATVFDTHGPATSITLTGVPATQLWISVAAYDTNGNAGMSAAGPSVYGLAAPNYTWTAASPNAVVGNPYTVQFNGFYANLSIASGPAGATINPATGLFSWSPSSANLGNNTIVVAATSQNGWGTEFMTLRVPVYFSNAPSLLGMTRSVDPTTGATWWTATWNSPTQNVANIVSYQITVQPSTAGAAPIVVNVAETGLSTVLKNLGAIHGQIQVAAADASGNLGVPSAWLAFY